MIWLMSNDIKIYYRFTREHKQLAYYCHRSWFHWNTNDGVCEECEMHFFFLTSVIRNGGLDTEMMNSHKKWSEVQPSKYIDGALEKKKILWTNAVVGKKSLQIFLGLWKKVFQSHKLSGILLFICWVVDRQLPMFCKRKFYWTVSLETFTNILYLVWILGKIWIVLLSQILEMGCMLNWRSTGR